MWYFAIPNHQSPVYVRMGVYTFSVTNKIQLIALEREGGEKGGGGGGKRENLTMWSSLD